MMPETRSYPMEEEMNKTWGKLSYGIIFKNRESETDYGTKLEKNYICFGMFYSKHIAVNKENNPS